MDITKCLTISTAHVTENTVAKLGNEADKSVLGLTVYEKGEYGYWVWVGDNLKRSCNVTCVPEDLWQCITVAYAYDCQWLCLDRDAGTVDELPMYDWQTDSV